MGNAKIRARTACLIAATGLALPAAAQVDPLAEPFDQTFDWRELLPSQGGDGSLGYVIRNCGDEWSMGSGSLPPSRAGDVNGDGRDDLLHSVTVMDSPRYGFGVLMSDEPPYPTLDISDPLANHGFQFRFGTPGFASTALGDINGDDIDDVAGSTSTYYCPYSCYSVRMPLVVFGRDMGTSGPFEPINPQTPQLRIERGTISDQLGDMNGDGIDDFAITTRVIRPEFHARTVLVFGRAPGTPFPDAASAEVLAADGGGMFIGSTSSTFAARSHASAGDLNGDGRQDLAILSDQSGERTKFGTYVVFGRDSDDPFPSDFDLSTGAPAHSVFFRTGLDFPDVMRAGCVGDINGDGIDDLGILASRLGTYRRLYVVFGRHDSHRDPFPSLTELPDLDGRNGFKISGGDVQTLRSMAVRPFGDANGDGVDDLILGDRILFGRNRQPFPAVLTLEDVPPEEMIRFVGSPDLVLSLVGDVNDDGVPDLSLGGLNGTDCEVAAIIYGRRPPPPCPADMDRDGALTIYDWLTFTNAWEAQDPLADVDGDGAFSLLDFLVYQVWFAAGCP